MTYNINKQAIEKGLYPKKVILLLDLSDIYDEGARWFNDDNSKPKLKSDFLYPFAVSFPKEIYPR